MYDYCIVGGGIVGLATALELTQRRPDARLVLLEKEGRLAAHQTGHNSGVIHSGIYYQPGSLKARLCTEGARDIRAFAVEHGLPVQPIGKLIVAASQEDLTRLDHLHRRATANQVVVQRLSENELTTLEPAIRGRGALLVESAAITDYGGIAGAMADELRRRGAVIELGARVVGIDEAPGAVTVQTHDAEWQTARLVVCAGLQADRLARRAGIDIGFQIIPFRGEYYRLPSSRDGLIERMIYPVPDPAMPFLGIHLTPTLDGAIMVGPNAVLGLSREGYRKGSINLRDVATYARFGGMWKLAAKHAGTGVREVRNSLFSRSYLAAIHRYCPELVRADLQAEPAGIRAQAVLRDGTLVDDFRFAETPRMLHVCNAPSPAATSSMPIARYIVDRVLAGTR